MGTKKTPRRCDRLIWVRQHRRIMLLFFPTERYVSLFSSGNQVHSPLLLMGYALDCH